MLPKDVDNTFNETPRAEDKQAESYETDDADYYQKVFTQRVNLWMDNPRMKDLILDPHIGKMCCELEGIDAIRVWHDQTLIKPPWGNPTGWHLDNPYWSFHSPHAISIWIALDDATCANGCLWFIPGSHKKQSFENVAIGQNYGSLFQVHPEWGKKEAVCAEMKAGSCSFHNGITAHGAGCNNTPYHRRAMTCAFMPDGATFNGQQNVLPKEYFKTLKVGDVLDNDEQNPVVYSKDMALTNA
jgi:ectoine hydroxylase-related dioxygenase (phytanoyl-CoA dioxygenase family)